jgi:hypothetical protein
MLDIFLSGRNLFVLYLVLAGRFMVPLFPCNTRAFFADSALVRHLIGFVTLMFFCVVTDSELDGYMPLGTLFATTIIIYFWFLISSKMTANWWFILVAMLAAIYIIDIYRQGKENIPSELEEQFTTAKKVLIGLSLAVTLVGFLIYIGEKKLDYKSKFDYATLILGTTTCKGTPNIQPYWKSLGAAFMEVPRPMTGGFFDGIPPVVSSLSTGMSDSF